MQNKIRSSNEKPPSEEPKEETQYKSNAVFSFDQNSLKLLPYIFFFVVVGILYIANRHYTHRKVREITQLRQKVEELRVHYTTLKAEVMTENQQAGVLKSVTRLGIKEPQKNKIRLSRK